MGITLWALRGSSGSTSPILTHWEIQFITKALMIRYAKPHIKYWQKYWSNFHFKYKHSFRCCLVLEIWECMHLNASFWNIATRLTWYIFQITAHKETGGCMWSVLAIYLSFNNLNKGRNRGRSLNGTWEYIRNPVWTTVYILNEVGCYIQCITYEPALV